MRGLPLRIFLLPLLLLAGAAPTLAASTWDAPAEAIGYANSIKATAQSVAAGRQVFQEYCHLCHGEQGRGDGPTSHSLTVKPADLSDKARMQGQSDGALAWKILTGRGPMPSWAPVLNEEQIWNLVNYIRSLSR